MEHTPNNPSTNSLGSGVTESDLANAIQYSGYPLQTIIANSLRDNFYVQDEWAYIDRDTKELRTIDLLTSKNLYDRDSPEKNLVRPSINLIIECKQSDLPMCFFSPTKSPLLDFPVIAGLSQDYINIKIDEGTLAMPPLYLLRLENHKFVQEPFFCYTLSKSVRRGKDLELSGNESYNSLILPIIKSLLHYKITEEPSKIAATFDAHITLGVAVLNAPMVGVKVLEKSNEQIMIPWVRVIRHEYFEDLEPLKRSKLFVIDVVHKDFFQEYIEQHVLPFANEFAALILKKQQVISSGQMRPD